MKINKKILASGLGLSLIFCIGSSSFAATGTVNTETVRVRAASNTDSDIILNLDQNDKVEVLGEEGEWYQVKSGESTGFIHKNYLDVEGNINTEETTSAEPVVSEENKETEKPEVISENKEEKKNEKKIANKLNNDSDLFAFPSFSSSKVTSVTKGTEVKIIKIFNNWSKVSVGGKEGWIANKKLIEVAETEETETPVEEEQEEVPEEETTTNEINQKGYVNADSVNLRKGAGTSFESVAGLVKYEVLMIISEENGWYVVRTTDNMNGYVSKDLVVIGEPPVTSRSAPSRNQESTENYEETSSGGGSVAPSPVAGDVVATAMQYLGYNYVYGGSSPSSGFDCSGFTSYVYGACGSSISRTSYGQADDGVAVDRSDLQPGDLLLFNNGGGGSIGHVGIYVGDGTFIHAANPSKGVVYDTIDSGYYATYYGGARRIN
ncbi:MAG: SH3 domain-containing protein [Clostridia bacterium]|nr:SH3 domain-containing protein [Clostridia bacterium]